MKKITLLAALMVVFTSNAQLIDEGFADITALTGWDIVNASDEPNNDWFQGNDAVFPAFDGDPTHYLGSNFQATSGTDGDETISVWMKLPALDLENGDEMSFQTRTGEASNFPDRLEIRISPDGTDTDPSGPNDVGSYTELLLSVNENLDVGGYPEAWTEFIATVSGLSGEVNTRLAIRYFVTDAGPNGSNSNYIGIDRVVVTELLGVDDNAISSVEHSVTSNELVLRAARPFENVEIYNILGQQVINQRLNATSERVDISALNQGVYVARVMVEGQVSSFKIVKR